MRLNSLRCSDWLYYQRPTRSGLAASLVAARDSLLSAVTHPALYLHSRAIYSQSASSISALLSRTRGRYYTYCFVPHISWSKFVRLDSVSLYFGKEFVESHVRWSPIDARNATQPPTSRLRTPAMCSPTRTLNMLHLDLMRMDIRKHQ